MSLAAREQRILDGIETALQAGGTHLTSMFAIFARLTGDEENRGRKSWRTGPGGRGAG